MPTDSPGFNPRYSRQTVLPEIGQLGQERISRAKVLCVGVGGLGSPSSLYLAAAGVGTLGLVDADQVSVSNLQRQVLFRSQDAGRKKTDVAQEQLRALNPEVLIQSHFSYLDASNVMDLISAYDIVIDGSDNFETKFLLNDVTVKLGIPLIYGSISGFEGQVALFSPPKTSCFRCLHPRPPESKILNCAETGVIGSVAGIIGSLQALEAIKWIVSEGVTGHSLRPLLGTLWVIDASTGRSRSYVIPKRPDCPICSLDPMSIRIQMEASVCQIQETPVSVVRERMATGSAILLDVREESEWKSGHIPDARHWPLSRLQRGELPSSEELEKDAWIAVQCQAGARSKLAIDILAKNGFQNLRNLTGGINAWILAGFPVSRF